MINVLANQNSILNQYLAEIRSVEVQNDRMRFRKNMERISEILGYEISKSLSYSERKVQTPLGEAKINLPEDKIIIASILRAGLSMHGGLLNRFDKAENAFISAYREKTLDNSVKINVEYKASPELSRKTLILADPMLATGQSILSVYNELLKNGIPKRIIFAIAIASKQAVKHIQKTLPEAELWIGAIDPELNDKAYIVPGLGDAGDLAYGTKL